MPLPHFHSTLFAPDQPRTLLDPLSLFLALFGRYQPLHQCDANKRRAAQILINFLINLANIYFTCIFRYSASNCQQGILRFNRSTYKTCVFPLPFQLFRPHSHMKSFPILLLRLKCNLRLFLAKNTKDFQRTQSEHMPPFVVLTGLSET